MSKITLMSWEEAVIWLKNHPDKQHLVRACFFDDPLIEAAKRYHSSTEWIAIQKLLPNLPGKALDLGAGMGIASYALAADGWETTAVEPNPSYIVGAGAIQKLASQSNLPIAVVEEMGEQLPFNESMFDLVHARQVLHHSKNLENLCKEVFRVLRSGGLFIATREHVINQKEDLAVFQAAHPLHHLYGGENAYSLKRYLSAINLAGFTLKYVYSPWESDINLFPQTFKDAKDYVSQIFRWPFPQVLPSFLIRFWSRRLSKPGRLYSFVALRP
jgi:SAM-dependent methyltransferase